MLMLQSDDNIMIQIALINEFPTGVTGFIEYPTDVGIEEATGGGVGIMYEIIRVAVTTRTGSISWYYYLCRNLHEPVMKMVAQTHH